MALKIKIKKNTLVRKAASKREWRLFTDYTEREQTKALEERLRRTRKRVRSILGVCEELAYRSATQLSLLKIIFYLL